MSLTAELYKVLTTRGADLVGFGDMTALPAEVRDGLPTGVSVAVKYPRGIIRGIHELPTADYFEWYQRLNDRLDAIVTAGASFLVEKGHRAVAQTRERVGAGEKENFTRLPHKTVATRAGLGWIGKSALFVTREYGSMIRLSSILTDAPLETSAPVNASQCGGCTVCMDACPAGAVSGKLWDVTVYRDEFFDADKCRATARERAMRGFGGSATVCGKCIEICPFTQRYLNSKEKI